MLFSIVIRSCNSAASLEASLESVFMQNCPAQDYELILVDDGSTDGTAELAGIYRKQHPNFRFLRIPTVRGEAAALNYGLQAAQGKYFLRLGAGDAVHPDMLSRCIELLEAGNASLVYCDFYEVVLADKEHQVVQIEQLDKRILPSTGVAMLTEAMSSLGGYRPLFLTSLDMCLRYLDSSDKTPHRIPVPLYYHSTTRQGQTAGGSGAMEGWDELEQVWGREPLRLLMLSHA